METSKQIKKVLIISPYFPPVNAADMQRIRMSLPYFNELGWNAEVVTVDPAFADLDKDELLTKSIPQDLKIHYVKAYDKRLTSTIGLGSIALRSLFFFRRKVNQLLKNGRYDVIYFSTTQFPVCILGAYWKRRFHIPYVIDMQDPWHSDYYKDKPKHQQPSKYWFSYRLNKYLEPIAVKNVDGLISVSEQYIHDLKQRYPVIAGIPESVIPFSGFEPDMQLAQDHRSAFENLLSTNHINIVYIGRGGADMNKAISPLFKALQTGLTSDPETFGKLRFYFIGTSYAPKGRGKPSILSLAEEFKVDKLIVEITDRISYYHTLTALQQADALFIPGSDDPKYIASKLFPYLLTRKPLLAIFHKQSPAIKLLHEFGAEHVYAYQTVQQSSLVGFLTNAANGMLKDGQYSPEALKKYSAQEMTHEQCRLFEAVLSHKRYA
ncbi:MAG: glycosyltransferase [Mucilaginibacter sp.]